MSARPADERLPLLPADRWGMAMLAAHVPISLLVDLALPNGPPSEEILDTDGRPITPWWQPSAPRAGCVPPGC